MKYGIYYAFWEKEWNNNFAPYVKKCSDLGFDVLEVACGAFHELEDSVFVELKQMAEENHMLLSGGYGPRKEHNLASTDAASVKATMKFYEDMFRKMKLAGIDRIGGALYSYWPVNFAAGIDKPGDWKRSVEGMRELADLAADYDVTLNMEVLNRFEGYLLNQAYEGLDYVKEVDRPNVKVMLDTFHMNIEETSIIDAILSTEGYLGHFHVGEANRRCPEPGGRFSWEEIGAALKKINYDGYVIMEPFVKMGGQVGSDIHLWRDLSDNADEAQMDATAGKSVAYLREVMEK